MSDSEQRPEPLRVPVVDVASRQSLVGAGSPPAGSGAATGGVLQRAVRIISDRPPEAEAPKPPRSLAVHILNASSYDVIAGNSAGAAEAVPELSLEQSIADACAAGSLQDLLRGAIDDAYDGADPLVEHDYAPAPSADHASLEVQSLETFELDEDFGLGNDVVPARGLHADDTLPDELELEGTSIEVSIPPPSLAVQAALRRFPPGGEAEITVSFDEDESDENRSISEFEELDLDASLTTSGEAPTVSQPPPPPAGRAASASEPPGLQALARAARSAEAKPSKPRARPWWEVFFDDDYLRTVRPPTHQQIARQCDFISKRLGLKPGATVLDVGCGLGLQAVELASRGYLSVGLDLSLAMLSRASEEAQARGTKINFLHADMREMNFEGNFDAVMCVGTTLGYFDDEANKRVIERLFRALRPNGVLLLDVVNRDHVLRTQPNLIWFEGDGCVCMEESEFNFFTSRLHVKRTVILETGKQRENEYSLRLYSLHELGQLLHQFGFRVIEVSGREALPGVFFGQESPNMMVIAERRASPNPKVEGPVKPPAAD